MMLGLGTQWPLVFCVVLVAAGCDTTSPALPQQEAALPHVVKAPRTYELSDGVYKATWTSNGVTTGETVILIREGDTVRRFEFVDEPPWVGRLDGNTLMLRSAYPGAADFAFAGLLTEDGMVSGTSLVSHGPARDVSTSHAWRLRYEGQIPEQKQSRVVGVPGHGGAQRAYALPSGLYKMTTRFTLDAPHTVEEVWVLVLREDTSVKLYAGGAGGAERGDWLGQGHLKGNRFSLRLDYGKDVIEYNGSISGDNLIEGTTVGPSDCTGTLEAGTFRFERVGE